MKILPLSISIVIYRLIILGILSAMSCQALAISSLQQKDKSLPFQSRYYEIVKDAEDGFPEAQFLLGMMYRIGYIVEEDLEKASYWLHTSAMLGYAEAQSAVGSLYEFGDTVVQDTKIAAYWFQLAALQEHGPAEDKLGHMYANGVGVMRDFREALKWFERAMTHGYLQGQQNLAWLLATAPEDELRDGGRALLLIEPILKENEHNPGVLDTLAAIYAEIGRFEEAAKVQEKALGLLINSPVNDEDRAVKFTKRLEFYQKGVPWRWD